MPAAQAAPALPAGQEQAASEAAGPAQLLGEAYRALQAQEFATAFALATDLAPKGLRNRDYALYVLAQSAFFLGRYEIALNNFRALAAYTGSRFRARARWRIADCLWHLEQYRAASAAYRALLARAGKTARPAGDLGVARFRLAEARARRGNARRAIRDFKTFLRTYPAHPLAADAERRLRQLGGERAARLSARDRIARAQTLTAARLWHESIAELAQIGDDVPTDVRRERDFWTGMTLFKMRRRYKDAGDILLGLYRDMGSRAAEAMFHGARALSRADYDTEAIAWYQRLVAAYPRSQWAAEAQFLSGWLAFNMGDYEAGIPHFETTLDRYGSSRWAGNGRWFLAFSYFLLGDYQAALPRFESLARQSGKLEGGKGHYWQARSLQKLGRRDQAISAYRALVGRFPFSWYAHLARARLAEQGIAIGPFGDQPRDPSQAPAIDDTADRVLAADPLIRATDELLAAGLDLEAGSELRRGESQFLKRHPRSAALAMLMDRYRRAGNFNRPWMLAVVRGGRRALDAKPTGNARLWWEHAYPLAYRELVETARPLGNSPPYYLYAIMRKESGFNANTVSYADAIGLLQMIPPTTRRVVTHLGMTYTDDLLYEPASNIRVGSWYIGRLFHKFKGQIPISAGSYNSGPRPVMRWLNKNGQRPIDEFVELVSYRQTRGYMKKVTETYSRYLYLYEGVVYEQPLAVDAVYIKNELTY